jgi:hypothetical protein
MALLHEDTTQSLTNDARSAETGFETDHDQFMRNSTGSSTKENISIACQLTTPWL